MKRNWRVARFWQRLPKGRRRVISGVILFLLLFVLFWRGCAGDPSETPAEDMVVVVEPEDVFVVRSDELRAGPLISGTLRPYTEATIRAEIGGTVTEAPALEGQSVGAGDLLARIHDPGVAEQNRSAEAAVSSARVVAENARRDVSRSEALLEAGAISRQALEGSRSSLSAALAQLSSAEAALAAARKSAGAASVQSPLDGTISSKSVNRGDVVQIGAELYRVVDPSRMQLEANVSADALTEITVGSSVQFTVQGYPGRLLTGTVERINPAVDPATRQIPIHISIPNEEGTLVAGLFAEGRVNAIVKQALLVPFEAVEEVQGQEVVRKIEGMVVEESIITTGARDEEREVVEVVRGLSPGDTILVGPARELASGTRLRITDIVEDSPSLTEEPR